MRGLGKSSLPLLAASMGLTLVSVGEPIADQRDRPLSERRRRVLVAPKRPRPVYVQTREIDRRLRQEARNRERQNYRLRAAVVGGRYNAPCVPDQPHMGLSRRGRLVLA